LDGTLDEVIKPFDLAGKFRAFGFEVQAVRGDDIAAIRDAVLPERSGEQRPLVVILDSLKGQGVAYLENLKNSHHLRLTPDVRSEIEKAIAELEAAYV
jgi:transketolase